MNKKAMNTYGLIIGAVVMGVLLIVLLRMINDTDNNIGKVTNSLEALSNDHDGDDIYDRWDTSPCVTGEEKITAIDRKEYFYFADAIKEGSDFNCNAEQFFGPDTDIQLQLKTEAGTDKKVCIYPTDTCILKLKEDYERIREEKNQNS